MTATAAERDGFTSARGAGGSRGVRRSTPLLNDDAKVEIEATAIV
jgi:hypothetical protein